MSIISAGGAVTGAGGPAGPNPRDYFNTVLYTGNGATQSITGVGFQPDWVITKTRSISSGTSVADAVRGASNLLGTATTAAEVTQSAGQGITSFDSDGFSLGTDASIGSTNFNGATYVAWNWKANGAGVSNSAGTITSTVSANTDSGFSIVTYTGTGSAATVGHGLGVAPDFIIIKQRDTTRDWVNYHSALGVNKYIQLSLTSGATTSSGYWGSVDSNTFGLPSFLTPNQSGGTYVAYCFAEIAGFSKFGSYTGNGSATGPSVTTDFEPTWLMIKRTDSTGDWIIHDSARDASNPRTEYLEPNTTDAEATGNDVDFNSTGFQIKSSSATVNANGGTYIYMCIA